MKKGFSLIELLVVFSIVALIMAVAIPGFLKFNQGQVLKTAAADLRDSLREAQSSSILGKKQAGCGKNDTLVGYYVTFTNNQILYSVGIRCGVNNIVDEVIKTAPFSTTEGVSVKSLITSPSYERSPVTILFRPVNKGVKFIDGESGDLVELDVESVEVILTNGVDDYSVIISKTGDVYDKR